MNTSHEKILYGRSREEFKRGLEAFARDSRSSARLPDPQIGTTVQPPSTAVDAFREKARTSQLVPCR